MRVDLFFCFKDKKKVPGAGYQVPGSFEFWVLSVEFCPYPCSCCTKRNNNAA